MDTSAVGFPCVALAGGQRQLRLRCLLPFSAESGIAAYVAGMEVARIAPENPVRPGQELLLPLRRLPRVDLPVTIRFSTGDEAQEIAPPFPLASAAAAAQLFGPGGWRAEELRVELGLLRGVLMNAENGLAEPIAFARLNDSGARLVVLGRPVTLNDGSACWPFELPLLAEDLLDSGLTLTLHIAGAEAPLASLAWSRAWAGEEDRRLVALEARLAELERGAEARLQQIIEEQRRNQVEQAERIDAFIDYAGALLLDRVAGTASEETGGDPALAALKALIASAGQRPAMAPAAAEPPPASPASRAVMPDSDYFSFGWHRLERDERGMFRWMTQNGVVTNPKPHRPVMAATVETLHLYGAERPVIRARLDGAETEVAVEEGEAPGRFRLRLITAGPLPCRTLRLESLATGSPARDGISTDDRVLSLAVARVVFDYAE
jgi:hypothetical protein